MIKRTSKKAFLGIHSSGLEHVCTRPQDRVLLPLSGPRTLWRGCAWSSPARSSRCYRRRFVRGRVASTTLLEAGSGTFCHGKTLATSYDQSNLAALGKHPALCWRDCSARRLAESGGGRVQSGCTSYPSPHKPVQNPPSLLKACLSPDSDCLTQAQPPHREQRALSCEDAGALGPPPKGGAYPASRTQACKVRSSAEVSESELTFRILLKGSQHTYQSADRQHKSVMLILDLSD